MESRCVPPPCDAREATYAPSIETFEGKKRAATFAGDLEGEEGDVGSTDMNRSGGCRPPSRSEWRAKAAEFVSFRARGAAEAARLMGDRIRILVVEDSAADARLIMESLSPGRVESVCVVKDGSAALDYLATAAVPELMILDLNLPKVDGREILKHVRANERLNRVPVVVFTTSESAEDIERAYELGANCYVAKPTTLERFRNVVALIERFWLGTVTLPVASA
jgi:two-component system, chemotaxis family, response regulator Rcp1